ncbi:thioredoxin family protein [Cryobacterium sp. PH31-AA6]|uniref:thioredoxin n=1 Tax=Cryobacterium sp. PH31-AA6 TaxID=3046205 RepID=UPI0024B87B60|nr:thioredoxin family protein [Cryobacterium sp. PH31-AA6]MDJ0324823.1 thioredoxin family protein [Cryobacterium sp. PH31-AA6]
MNMHKTMATVALTIGLIVAVSGCAGGQTNAPGGPAASAADEPAATAPVTPGTSAGAYVEYSDGIIAKTAGTKVLFFHASWCPNCRALEKDIIAGPIPAGLTIIKVDFDNSTDLRQKYGVTLQTTVVYVDDDGAELGKKVLSEDPSLDALVAAAP